MNDHIIALTTPFVFSRFPFRSKHNAGGIGVIISLDVHRVTLDKV